MGLICLSLNFEISEASNPQRFHEKTVFCLVIETEKEVLKLGTSMFLFKMDLSVLICSNSYFKYSFKYFPVMLCESRTTSSGAPAATIRPPSSPPSGPKSSR